MMAGLSIFYTYEPVCFSPPSSAHLSLYLATLILFHRLGSRPWQRIMQLHSVRVVLGREEGRKRGWVSSLQSVGGWTEERDITDTIVGRKGAWRGREGRDPDHTQLEE